MLSIALAPNAVKTIAMMLSYNWGLHWCSPLVCSNYSVTAFGRTAAVGALDADVVV